MPGSVVLGSWGGTPTDSGLRGVDILVGKADSMADIIDKSQSMWQEASCLFK